MRHQGNVARPTKKMAVRRHAMRQSITAELSKNRTVTERVADFLTDQFGSVRFFYANALFFAVWIIVNFGIVPGIPVFDPYPFGLLTMIVSLEAIFLSVIVLLSQNRSENIAEMREEINVQITMQAEREITKVLAVLERMEEHFAIAHRSDAELHAMLQQLDIAAIEKDVKEAIQQ